MYLDFEKKQKEGGRKEGGKRKSRRKWERDRKKEKERERGRKKMERKEREMKREDNFHLLFYIVLHCSFLSYFNKRSGSKFNKLGGIIMRLL